jgi:hypothetical protein
VCMCVMCWGVRRRRIILCCWVCAWFVVWFQSVQHCRLVTAVHLRHLHPPHRLWKLQVCSAMSFNLYNFVILFYFVLFYFIYFILFFFPLFVFCNIFVTISPVKFRLLSLGRARQQQSRAYPGQWGE